MLHNYNTETLKRKVEVTLLNKSFSINLNRDILFYRAIAGLKHSD